MATKELRERILVRTELVMKDCKILLEAESFEQSVQQSVYKVTTAAGTSCKGEGSVAEDRGYLRGAGTTFQRNKIGMNACSKQQRLNLDDALVAGMLSLWDSL